ncbi:nipped-B protein [Cylas formicarius]|uniref:nipped-B protein n=1 Tax=Cylas formicarius TaxID=197179 RepID=UPI0029587009|nr:nipped-B protein [Cylas formicarius]XP_060516002.1 nipped-B protein [Cylas formicarius]XP_060516003.1 nipped-B protein [Cylas formicarius]
MDPGIPNFPITLAGVASLTDCKAALPAEYSVQKVLPELPLPTPSPQTLSNKSLLFHPRVAEEAQNLLGIKDEILVPQLVLSLEKTSAEHIEVKDNYAGSDTKFDKEGMPDLLKALLEANPHVFSGNKAQVYQQQQKFLIQQKQYQQQQQYLRQQQQLAPQSLPQQQTQQISLSQPQPRSSPHNQQNIAFQPQKQEVQSHQPELATKMLQDTVIKPNQESAVRNKQDTRSTHPHLESIAKPLDTSTQPPLANKSGVANDVVLSSGQLQVSLPIGQHLEQQVNVIGADAMSKCNSILVNDHPATVHSTTSELRQLRRTRGQVLPSAGVKDATNESGQNVIGTTASKDSNGKTVYDSFLGKSVEESGTEIVKVGDGEKIDSSSGIKQPIVRLGRISVEDQLLMQKSLKEFVETKPNLAKQLGIELGKQTKNYKEDSDSDRDLGTRKRKRKNKSDDEFEPEVDPTDTFSALVGKRRRVGNKEENSEPQIVLSKPKLRRVEKKFVPVLQKLSTEELMESNTYVRFNKSVEHVLRSVEDIDFAEIGPDDMIQDEHLLSRSIIQELCTESAKLKVLGAMEMIPTDKLTRLLNILELTIRGGDRISPITDEDNESVRQFWLETTMERVMNAADANLICLYIMTSPNMSKRVYLEEVIDRIVLYIKYHLSNTIFPSYDSTYKLENKKKDGRRKKTTVSEKGILVLYTKISESINLLSELLNIQVLTDTSVLHASSMGISPFFVENVSEMQLACLKLVTTIFTKYESHRRLLLDDILASIARLPSTKRSLRTYRLNSEENIQMLTALVLQLIQCVVALPDKIATTKNSKDKTPDKSTNQVDKDVLICNKFEKATSTAGTFLKVFLSKCGNKSEEIDYRPLFENFVQDLLTTVNKPEWPATELLLSLLGKMLVQNFSNKSTDMSLRLASLDYLGVVAARLRRDSVLSRCKLNTIDQMIKDIRQEEMKDREETSSKKKHSSIKSDDDRTQFLQKILLDFLAVNSQNDESYKYARHFYIAQWYKDLVNEKTQLISGGKKKNLSGKKDDKSGDEDDSEPERKNSEQENADKFRVIEEKKKILLAKVIAFQESMSSGNRVQVFQTYIDYNSAELIAQFLASKRHFSQSFDQYLKAILIVLKETSIAIRTKAMKCLTMIVEADPSVLGRHDMQMGVNQSILDQSTSVREAAVDLIGKFVLRRPELIDKYYEILSPRILDTGVSVRKRVIKILKDICVECPEFPKIPEICVKMIRRINDEEGIRKLVMEVFQNMWFTPIKGDDSLLRKVMHITDVVASSKEIGLEWFEQLLLSLYKPKEDKDDSTKINTEPPKALLSACRQIVDCLIENILRLEENSARSGASERLVACVTTLQSFAKIRPQLLIKHASTLQPYLALKCHSEGDAKIISCVARMLELVVPLMEHPSDTFLAQLEEDAMKLILQYNRPIVSSCLSCLGSIINKVTHNFKLIRDCFKRFNMTLLEFKKRLETYDMDFQNNFRNRQLLRRSLFVVGLLLRHFDFKNPNVLGDLAPDTKDQVYLNMMYFLQQNNIDIQSNTLIALGSICIRHYEFMLEPELKVFYHRQLTMDDAPLKMKIEVLVNIENYLIEEENRMIQQDLEWSKRSKQENLKEMNDVSSGMASTVIQLYLKEIMQSYLHNSLLVRQPALRVIQLVYNQGLVHPVQIVPYLICMSTDPEKSVSHSADKTLQDIEKKYPGFIHTQASFGIRLSYQLQKILQNDAIVRGSKVKEQGEYPTALNGYLYSLLRNSRQQRRALILKFMKHFDEQARTSLSYMLYLADDLAYFPYQVQDEPLFIVQHIDLMISNSGTNLLQSFREGLLTDGQNKIPETENGEMNNVVSALDEDDDEDALAARVPEDASHLQACLTAAQGCLLLLVLKQHIKDIYGLSDGKIQLYSPSAAAKVYEKAISRRSNALFNPKATIQKIKEGTPSEYLDENGRRDLIRQYLDFKHLMLQLDPDDVEDDENKVMALGGNVNPQLNSGTPGAILTEADQLVLQNYKDHSPPKVPKLVISHRRFESDTKRTPRSQRSSEKTKKVRHKKKRRKIMSDSESENDYSDPDFMV